MNARTDTLPRPASQPASAAGKSHLIYIDNLRTTLITFVILLHLAITYGAEGDWYYKESGEANVVAFVIIMFVAAIGSAFVLGLFLLLAGYFTPRSYDKKGFGGFLVDRAKRLLVPLALYQLIIYPLVRYCVRIKDGFQGSLWDHLVEHFGGLNTVANGPVWFLMTLMIFSLFYALLRLAAKEDQKRQISLPGNRTILVFAIFLGFATFLTRIWLPVGTFYEPLHQEFAHYPQYIAMFAIGTLAFRGDWLEKFPASQSRLWGWVALLCVLTLPGIVIAAGALTGELDERGAGGWNWISFSYSIWEGFTCLAFSIITLTWYRKHRNQQNRLAAKMADATFAAYVLHPAVIVPFAIFLSGITIDLSLKFLIVAPIAVALTYIISYYFRRLPLVRNVF
jgi:surface polysaccharide O-acyltransferase-like enzyme